MIKVFQQTVNLLKCRRHTHDQSLWGANWPRYSLAIFAAVAFAGPALAKQPCYVFSYFTGNGEDGLHLAHSHDGLTWEALNDGRSFLEPKVGGRLMRDPCIVQRMDGTFQMVWTTSWGDQGIGTASSTDLINWSPQTFVPVMKHEPKARNSWAPEVTRDPLGKQFYVYWASTIPGRFPETDDQGDSDYNHRMYATTTTDFKEFTKTRLFYDPGFNVIDSTIIHDGDRFVMILKDETRRPPAKNLRVATASKITGPWKTAEAAFTPDGLWVEGPSLLKVGDFWHVYYDCYREHRFGAMRTRDFKTWEDISGQLSFPKGTRHGTAFEVSRDVLKELKEKCK